MNDSLLEDYPFPQDAVRLETRWHTFQVYLLRELVAWEMRDRDWFDYFAAGGIPVRYSQDPEQEIAPHFFFVDKVAPRERSAWVAGEEEGGRLPDVILEFISPLTAEVDRAAKKELFAGVFQTAECFFYNPETLHLEGFRLKGQEYEPIPPDPEGRLRSDRLGLDLGLWEGRFDQTGTWIRFFHPDGELVLNVTERAEHGYFAEEAELDRAGITRRRLYAERQRAEAAEAQIRALEAELARLRARLGEGREG